MQGRLPRCYVELDSSAFAHNLQRARDFTPTANLMAVIKANGYGHGIDLSAQHLDDADEFAVTSVEDALHLRQTGVSKPLTLLSPTFDTADLNSFSKNSIRPVIYEYEQLAQINSMEESQSLSLWVKVDTGMGRLGFDVDEVVAVCARLSRHPNVENISLMTHLANADNSNEPLNEQQISSFKRLLKLLRDHGVEIENASVLNSAGVVGYNEAAFDFVRPGIMLYGISPQQGTSAYELGLKPVMTLKSRVLSVRRMPAGSRVGYGGTYTLDSDSRLAYVACGYGDGYPRHAPSGTPVSVNGFLVPLVGRVSMDMLAIDIGELPVEVGNSVTLWGESNPIEDVAASAGTIAYELTCGITERVARLIV